MGQPRRHPCQRQPVTFNQLLSTIAVWHTIRFPDATQADILAKLLEEAGELARAAIGQVEGRPNRGVVGQEAAQTIVVIFALLARYYPNVDLATLIADELDRHTIHHPDHPL